MGTPSSINRQVLRKLCAKFQTFVTSVTIRPIFYTKRPDYYGSPRKWMSNFNMYVAWTDTISCSLPLTHSIPLLTVNAIVGVLGSTGNFLVCLAIATNSRQRRSSKYLLFSLATTNLIDTLICKPIVLDFISLIEFSFVWD